MNQLQPVTSGRVLQLTHVEEWNASSISRV